MSRVEEAKTLFGNLTEDRSRILLLNGIPTARILINCTELWPAEVWYYQRAENLGSEMALIFYQQGGLGCLSNLLSRRGAHRSDQVPGLGSMVQHPDVPAE